MRIVALPVVLCAGCGFQVGTNDSPVIDAPVGDTISDGDVDAAILDAPTDAPFVAFCLTPTIWEADFSSDPRALDINGDTINDWAIRNSDATDALPGVLAGGVWTEPAPPLYALDSQPKQDFTTKTRVTVRMRHAGSSATEAQYGAVFWVNVGFGDAEFAPLFFALTRVGAAQRLVLYTKNATQQTIEISRRDNLGTGMQEISMLVDPALRTVTLTAGLLTTTNTYVEVPSNGSDDRWATLTAWSSAAEFDRVRLEVCP